MPQKNKIQFRTPGEDFAVLPKRKNLIINLSDLELKLRDFKESVQNSFTIIDFVSILGLWLPILTGEDFKLFEPSINNNLVKGVYIGIAAATTLYILFRKVPAIFKRSTNDPKKLAIELEKLGTEEKQSVD